LKISKSLEPFLKGNMVDPSSDRDKKNGGVYVNRPFEEYLVLSHIEWHQLIPHTPQ
jgi:hypothetical protein